MAIAYDTTSGANPANGTSFTHAHTCTGTNPHLTVWIMMGNASDVVTGVTYGGVAMTRRVALSRGGGTGYLFGYTLTNASTGANNVVASASATMTGIIVYATSHTEADFDSANSKTTIGSTSFNIPTTVVASNSWLLAGVQDNAGNSTAGSGTVKRSALSAGFGQQCYDSNGTVGTGSQSLNMNNAGSASWDGVIISIKPYVAPVVARPYFTLLDVA